MLISLYRTVHTPTTGPKYKCGKMIYINMLAQLDMNGIQFLAAAVWDTICDMHIVRNEMPWLNKYENVLRCSTLAASTEVSFYFCSAILKETPSRHCWTIFVALDGLCKNIKLNFRAFRRHTSLRISFWIRRKGWQKIAENRNCDK